MRFVGAKQHLAYKKQLMTLCHIEICIKNDDLHLFN